LVTLPLTVAVLETAAEGACMGGWQRNFGYEYCIDSQLVTNAMAVKLCRSMNSELASITSDAECDYLANRM